MKKIDFNCRHQIYVKQRKFRIRLKNVTFSRLDFLLGGDPGARPNANEEILYLKTSSKAYLNTTSWTDFDSYLKWCGTHLIITIYSESWESSQCSCPYWKKHFICKYVIGIAYSLSLFEKFPSLDLGIEKNHKRGRRKRCAPALQRNSFGPLNPALINNTVPSTSTALQTLNKKKSFLTIKTKKFKKEKNFKIRHFKTENRKKTFLRYIMQNI
ncbi:hypothetical protein BpHYR1_034862 [Brachionus plicatilis]|uniref:SWIM-type domain-containing protein n=1 Tax=Brachionus plicatilis TaxID=10195 RepID=A0A3M7SHY6_BRAPC|nr:hypothetical protein BpHYR1_034862 [Brachionus plicatilis]